MRVLVTGGNGFIGTWVCAELEKNGHTPIVFDHHGNQTAHGWYECFLGDVRDRTSLSEAVSHVDGVIHLAAILGSSETIEDPYPAIETNIIGAVNMMEACLHYAVPMSMTSVGNAWLRSSGAGTYTIVKECAADLFEMYRRYRGLKGNLVRPTNAYGPGQSVHSSFGGTSSVRKIIPTFIHQALAGQPIEVYGDGEQISDCVWVGDVAETLVKAMLHAANGYLHPIAEVGPYQSVTVNEVARRVATEVSRQTGEPLSILNHLPMRAGEVKGVTKSDVSTLKPYHISLTSLYSGLLETVAYYRGRINAK